MRGYASKNIRNVVEACLQRRLVSVEDYATLLRSCGAHKCLEDGVRVHRHLMESGHGSDSFLGNLVVQMYGKCGSLDNARRAFAEIPRKNAFSWNLLMTAYAQNGQPGEVLELFKQMQQQQHHQIEANKFTFATALAACSRMLALDEGKKIHERIIAKPDLESDTVLETALLDMYTKCGSLDEARAVFNRIKNKDVVCWTALITACAQQGNAREALELYKDMVDQGLHPDPTAYSSVVAACATLKAVCEAKAIHERIIKDKRIIIDDILSNAIINMYAKCGMLEEATAIFKSSGRLKLRSDSWNTIIAAYAQHGNPAQVLTLYAEMEVEGVEPNNVTFTTIFYACNHAGMEKAGRLCYAVMVQDRGMSATREHHNCMIDLLGRAGRLQEAEELIESLQYRPEQDFVAWTSLLNACKMHRDKNRAVRIARRLSEVLDCRPEEVEAFNIGRLGDAMEAKNQGLAVPVRKLVASSSIQVGGKLHEFVAGDSGHDQNQEIRAELHKLLQEIKQAGYVPDASDLVRATNLSQETKEELLCYHSEKMAIAFGLISTPDGHEPLRIFKNLRVCSDCHAAAKFISSVRRREIILSDATRFHCFKAGLCSCGDYW